MLEAVVQNLASISQELEESLTRGARGAGGAVQHELSREDFFKIMSKLQLTTDGAPHTLSQDEINQVRALVALWLRFRAPLL